MITIAQRLQQLKNVDQIIILEPKKGIVQTGTFKELINKVNLKKLYDAGFNKIWCRKENKHEKQLKNIKKENLFW